MNGKLEYIIGNLKSFLMKEESAPMSADTHLEGVLFTIIETMSDDHLKVIYNGDVSNYGFTAVLSFGLYNYKYVGKPIPERYLKFYEKFENEKNIIS